MTGETARSHTSDQRQLDTVPVKKTEVIKENRTKTLNLPKCRVVQWKQCVIFRDCPVASYDVDTLQLMESHAQFFPETCDVCLVESNAGSRKDRGQKGDLCSLRA